MNVKRGREKQEQVGIHKHELELPRMDRNTCQILLPLTLMVQYMDILRTRPRAKCTHLVWKSEKLKEDGGKGGTVEMHLLTYIKRWTTDK